MQSQDPVESLRLEAAALRAEHAALEVALAGAERTARRLERLVAAVPGIVWESEGTLGEPGYRVTYAGGQIEQILGYSRQQWIASPAFWPSIVHPDDRARVLRDSAPSGHPTEHRFVARDGHEVWVSPRMRVLRGKDGAIVGTSIFAMDVTERVLAERAGAELHLRAQTLARRLDDLLASVPGVVWETRIDGASHVPSFYSGYLTTLTGYLPEELLGVEGGARLILHPEDQARVVHELGTHLGKSSAPVEFRLLTKDGRTLWVETRVRPVKGKGGELRGICGVIMDITARKLAERAQEQLENEMIAAQAEALAELSTPLLPISGDVLVMPLIGVVDAARTAQVAEVLLEGMNAARARVAIVDLTGVPSLDSDAADGLLRAARSVGLLGAEVVLTGLRPEVARTLVALGTDFSGLTTCRTLEGGLAHAARRSRGR
ncbi:MAG: PAS domain-containing protein [Byssovorax sp.]